MTVAFCMDVPACVPVPPFKQMTALQVFSDAAADDETDLFVEQDDLGS